MVMRALSLVMAITTFSFATKMPSIFKTLYRLFLLTATVCLTSNSASAQTWKPICVSGTNSTGAHNNTWQKVNTAGAGGNTWKKVGECKAATPPTPPGPPPFNGISFNTNPLAQGTRKTTTATFELRSDGTWFSSWTPNGRMRSGVQSGRWLEPGHSANDYEVRWALASDSESAYATPLRHETLANSAQGVYAPLSSGWKVWLSSYDGDYDMRSTITVGINIWIQKRGDPSISRFEYIQLSAWYDNGLSPG